MDVTMVIHPHVCWDISINPTTMVMLMRFSEPQRMCEQLLFFGVFLVFRFCIFFVFFSCCFLLSCFLWYFAPSGCCLLFHCAIFLLVFSPLLFQLAFALAAGHCFSRSAGLAHGSWSLRHFAYGFRPCGTLHVPNFVTRDRLDSQNLRFACPSVLLPPPSSKKTPRTPRSPEGEKKHTKSNTKSNTKKTQKKRQKKHKKNAKKTHKKHTKNAKKSKKNAKNSRFFSFF